MQALWKRFQYARDAIKDDDVGKAWDQACTGPGSSKTKRDLLVTYLRSDTEGPLSKKGSLWYKRLIEHTKTTVSRKTTVWEPFQAMKTQYGTQELMRRVARGSIICRRAEDDGKEWGFRRVIKEEYETEEVKNCSIFSSRLIAWPWPSRVSALSLLAGFFRAFFIGCFFATFFGCFLTTFLG